MKKLEFYRQCVERLLAQYAQGTLKTGEIEVQMIIERERDRYLILDVGWQGNRRIHTCTVHFNIEDGKIWIQENVTEAELGQALVEMGVAREDIILGFQVPSVRVYTAFGVA
ncbi:XisI protein [Lusitaniella coriacea LEGE 07157]|uniref:XisI protein n=1 Tax=Lusitaniella coriacea LEGE 07157 TaxID=945747 RepID=A0A8J7DX89_9CYAN|nr:XisI protein [Lusitaniella coriacea]MBE9116534.1 XisI protein [Lusitaniella coriacea LEGE 07157]